MITRSFAFVLLLSSCARPRSGTPGNGPMVLSLPPPKAASQTNAPQEPAQRAADASLSWVVRSDEGRWFAAMRSAGGRDEVIVMKADDLDVVARLEVSGSLVEPPRFIRENELVLVHRLADAGQSNEALLIDVPSGVVKSRPQVDDAAWPVGYRSGGSGTPQVELRRVDNPQDGQAPTYTLVVRRDGGAPSEIDLTRPVRAALATTNIGVSFRAVVGETLVVSAYSGSPSDTAWRLGFVSLRNGQVAFLPYLFGPGGDVFIDGTKLVAVQGADTAPLLIDLESRRVERVFHLPHEKPRPAEMDSIAAPRVCVRLDRKGHRLLLGNTHGPTRWFDLDSGKLLHSVFEPAFEFSDARWWSCEVLASAEGRWILTFSYKGFLAVADAATGRLAMVRDDGEFSPSGRAAIGNKEALCAAVLSDEGLRYAVACRGRLTRVIDIDSGALVELPIESPLAFANKGNWVLASDGLWSVSERRRVRSW